MNTAIIEMITGKENDARRAGSATAMLHGFILMRDATNNHPPPAGSLQSRFNKNSDIREIPLWAIDKEAKTTQDALIASKTRNERIQPYQKVNSSDFGNWYKRSYEFRDDCVIKIVGNRKIGSAIAVPQKGVLFLRAHHQAAHQRITMNLTNSPDSNLVQARIEGRFDVMTQKEIHRFYDGKIYTATLAQADPATHHGLFSIEELSPHNRPAPPVETKAVVYDSTTGQAREVSVRRTARRII